MRGGQVIEHVGDLDAVLAQHRRKLTRLDAVGQTQTDHRQAHGLGQGLRCRRLMVGVAQLAQLRQQSLQLPLKQQEQALVTQPVADGELANWRQNLAAYWQQSWSKLFQVRPAVAEDFINLSAEQQVQLRLTLQQQLLLAEQALLQGQQAVFSRAIQQAADLLQRYFAAESSAVQQAAGELVQLSQLALSQVELPVLQSPAQLERQLSLLSEEGL